MIKELKKLGINARKGLAKECQIEKSTGIGKISFPIKYTKNTFKHRKL